METHEKFSILPRKNATAKVHLVIQAIIVLAISLIFAYINFKRAGSLHPAIFEYGYQDGVYTSDLWFDGDIPKFKFMMIDENFIGHYLTSDHPFMSLILFLPFNLLILLFKQTVIYTIQIFVAGVTVIFSILLFFLLLKNGHKFFDSVIFVLLGLVSASATFWLMVPEAFSLGALSVMAALCLVESESFSRHPLIKGILINLLSLSVTITNWVTGIIYTLLYARWYRAIKIFFATILSASLIWVAEKIIFPYAKYFLSYSARTGDSFFSLSSGRAIEVFRSFFLHTMMMPNLSFLERTENPQILSVQKSMLSYEGVLGYIGLIFWIILLVSGLIFTLVSLRKDKVSQVVLITLFSQLGLQMVFGRETFLYSMHYLPLLIFTSANSLKTRFRIPILIISILTIVTGIINNQNALNNAFAYISKVGLWAEIINLPR